MKLKLVVSLMSAASLVVLPGVAAAHKHHHHHRHHEVRTEAAVIENADYKGAVVEVCPLTDQFTVMMDTMDHNIGRARPTEDCNKLISFAGGINFDAHWGNRSMGYQGENNQRLSLNDAYLNIFGIVNDWTRAFMSLSYNDVSGNEFGTSFKKAGQYSNVYPNNTLTMEQAFIRFSNFDESPFFAQIGKQFQDFGKYNIHPITRSMDQVLSETLRTSAEVGFLTHMGFHGSAWAFDNPLRQRNVVGSLFTAQGHSQTDWGVSLGYDHPSDQFGFDVGASWMYNMAGVNDVAEAISQFEFATNSGGNYYNNVGAVAVYGDINTGPFSLLARYVTALTRFNINTLQNHLHGTQGAKPWAGNVQAGYAFNAFSRNQNIYLGYQFSGDTVNLFLPKSRWTVGYNIDVLKNTTVGVEWAHDHDRSTNQGGTGLNSSIFAARAAVKFG